jgi:hypothetical protein
MIQFNNNHLTNTLNYTPPVGIQLFKPNYNDSSSISEPQHYHTTYVDTLQPIQITQTPLGHTKEINLTPELETLQPVIASQHIALKAHIIDLGILSPNLTNTIVKKKESSLKLMLLVYESNVNLLPHLSLKIIQNFSPLRKPYKT